MFGSFYFPKHSNLPWVFFALAITGDEDTSLITLTLVITRPDIKLLVSLMRVRTL